MPLTIPASRHKYGAKPVTVDGIRFHSTKEAARYGELKLLLKAGDARQLRLQPRYALIPLTGDPRGLRDVNAATWTMKVLPVAYYVADFEYEESDRGYGGIKWSLVVEDSKGVKTEVYKLKKRWFEAQYGIRIRET